MTSSALVELQQLLQKADIIRDEAEIESLLRGAAAAPPDSQDRWTDLIAPDAPQAVRSQLAQAGRAY
ncbi:MAG TPA: hypothetical protein DCL95_14060, partial [Rhodospirillaceae bacterium]|nr:hypothetical protein [Rhodospirillaceae bacterium]